MHVCMGVCMCVSPDYKNNDIRKLYCRYSLHTFIIYYYNIVYENSQTDNTMWVTIHSDSLLFFKHIFTYIFMHSSTRNNIL